MFPSMLVGIKPLPRFHLACILITVTVSVFLSGTLLGADATVYVGFQHPNQSFTRLLIGKSTGTVVGARVATGGRFAFEQSIGYSPNLMSYLIDVFNTQS